MKRLMKGGIASIALTMSRWCSASTLDIAALCGDFDLLKHSENRVYRGRFEGGGVAMEHALVVTPVTRGGETVVFYAWGEQRGWNVSEAGCRPGTGTVKGDTLTIYWDGIQVSYEFSGDDASVKYTWSGFTRNGRLTRASVAASGLQTAEAKQTPAKPQPPLSQIRAYAVGDKFVWRENGDKTTIYEVTRVKGSMVSFRAADGCAWTVRVNGFAPVRTWKNCSEFAAGTQTYKRHGDIFPLRVGNSESWTFRGKNTRGDTWTGTRKCKVKGTADVTVPAGTFKTHHVVCTEPRTQYRWHFSPELGMEVFHSQKPLKGSSGSAFHRELVRTEPAT